MAEFTANANQTVAPGAAVLFDSTAIVPNRSVYHRDGSAIFTLRGLTYQPFARFKVVVGGNVAVPTGGTAGPITFAIAISGEPDENTTMQVTPAAVGEYFNISRETYINVPGGCCTQISLENTTATEADIKNVNLIIERVA